MADGFFIVMNLQQKFVAHIRHFPVIQPRQVQLLAVSGGADSAVLCDLMAAAGYEFVIAHCNFQLRGAESERDEQFVKSLGSKYGKQVFIRRFETEKIAAAQKQSIQVAARELRYGWFKALVNGQWSTKNNDDNSHAVSHSAEPFGSPLHYILTAHHANDNIETLLMNFFKGTGIAGLHGILPLQGKIFRPILFAKKEDILAYAAEKNLPFVEDSSNLADKYTRNFFRQHLMPKLKKVYPEVEDNLLKNIDRFTEAGQLYNQAVDQHKKKLLEVKGSEVHIPVLKLQKTLPLATIVYEIIKDCSFTPNQVQDVVRLLDSESGKYVSSATHRIIKNRNWLIISPSQVMETAHLLIEEGTSAVSFAAGSLRLKVFDRSAAYQVPSDAAIAAVDLSQITFPLLLRRRKAGDYFYPLGMKKKKKLSRFFTDQKLSKPEKENVWVLEMNKKIVWIIGHRIDDRFKILPATKKVLEISSQIAK